MKPTARDDAPAFAEIYEQTMPMLYRLCFAYLKNRADTQDAVHAVYLKLLQHKKPFASDEHRKAWLIVTARNHCKNNLLHWWRHVEPLDALDGALFDPPPQHGEVTQAVLALPEKYKTPVFLYYYEGYQTDEIAKILKKPHSTIRRHLSEARKLLGGVLGEQSDP